jgi:hypothetical protein
MEGRGSTPGGAAKLILLSNCFIIGLRLLAGHCDSHARGALLSLIEFKLCRRGPGPSVGRSSLPQLQHHCCSVCVAADGTHPITRGAAVQPAGDAPEDTEGAA